MNNLFTRNTNPLPPAPVAATPPQYRAVVGISTETTRYEPGAVVPREVIEAAPWLLERGAVQFISPTPEGTQQ